ncbi:cbb3-type cytochrome oxidase subunit 3 [Bacillus luteolus]|nr:hypothetical protein [Cytobacillus luteolus]MBP1940790.1 cbb3-type cytochrome oxidase subunit 3 [Cytobacillus luteolus]
MIFGLVLVIATFAINILGLMGMFPLYITSPILFVAILIFLFNLNNRKRFNGFN